jgi:hypothetical protein
MQCPSGSLANNFGTGCTCTDPNQIFELKSFQCISCGDNYMPDRMKTACVCKTGYQTNANGVCVSTLSISCPNNQRMNGGKCICQPGYAFNGKNICTACPAGSQPTSDQFICICANGRPFNPVSFTCSNSLLPQTLSQNSSCINNQRMSGGRCICPIGYAFN